jgi:hypothetical protein
MAIIAKLGHFRAEKRFPRCDHKFVSFKESAKRWHSSRRAMAVEDWYEQPRRFRLEPAEEAEGREFAEAVRRAAEEPTQRRRLFFVAIALSGVPLDALAAERSSTRNPTYNIGFDAGVGCGQSLPLTGPRR